MDSYNNKSLMEKVAIATEKSRKRHLERNEYKESNVVLLTNWISKINIKKNNTSKERNQRKEQSIKEQRDMILNESLLK